MKLSEWAKKQGISYRTAWRWFHAGTLPVDAQQVDSGTIIVKVQANNEKKKAALYARVSSSDQKSDLNSQVARLTQFAVENKLSIEEVITEIGSAMNGKRPKLLKLLRDQSVGIIVVEHRDRLIRFGFEYLEAALAAQERVILVVDHSEMKDDLIRDMTEVLTSFCARLYGKRAAKHKAERAIKAAGGRVDMQSTFETKLNLTERESGVLLEQARQMCGIERQLFVRLYAKKEEANQVKRDTLAHDQITGRQYNSILYSLKGRISNIEENHKFQAQQLPGQIKATRQKIKTIEEEIDKAKSPEKKKQRLFVLHQKKRKKANLEARLLSVKKKLDRPVPDVCFGSRKIFNAQHYLEANGYKTHAEWQQDWDFARNNQFTLIGSKDETAGNQSAQLNLEAKTLKVRLTDSLVNKYGQKILVLSNVAFPYGQDKIEKALKNRQAIFHRFVARKEGSGIITWFLKTSIEETEAEIITDSANGIIGLDLNADHIALGYLAGDGNPLGESKIHFDINNKTSGQIKALFGDAVKQIVDEAVERKVPIAIENLDFSKKKTELGERGKQYARMLSGFAYALFFTLLTRRAAKYGVQVRRRNAAYTSIIGAVKFSAGYGLSTDGGAAIAIGRRALNFGESLSTRAKSPSLNRILIEANTEGKEKHVWSRWSTVKKRLGQDRKSWPGRCSEKQLEASLNKNVRLTRLRRLSESASRTAAALA